MLAWVRQVYLLARVRQVYLLAQVRQVYLLAWARQVYLLALVRLVYSIGGTSCCLLHKNNIMLYFQQNTVNNTFYFWNLYISEKWIYLQATT